MAPREMRVAAGEALGSGKNRERIQREIAALAARMIAEDGHDCEQAKRKAAQEFAANSGALPRSLPDDEQVDAALREHLRLFGGDEHRIHLRRLRELALEWMQNLEPYAPHLVGAVLDGSATAQSAVALHLYADSAKDVELSLLARGVDFRVAAGVQRRVQEVIGFLARPAAGDPAPEPTGIVLSVYYRDALRVAPAQSPRAREAGAAHPVELCRRANTAQLRRLLDDSAGAAGHPVHPAAGVLHE